jgi:hypothetical protein
MKVSDEQSKSNKPNKEAPDIESLQHLNLLLFKVHPCKTLTNHLPKQCFYYHDYKKDRRRNPSLYIGDLCPYIANEKDCINQESCTYAHNRVEEFYHPTKYKTKFCSTYPNHMNCCEYGPYCCFAHSNEDITIDLLHLMHFDLTFYLFHFKTVWCPFNESNHQRDVCPYSHNWQDYRRKPTDYVYDKEQCENWDSNKTIVVYTDGCVYGMKCTKSHGWKENEYHPNNYKVNHCKHGETCGKKHCPYFHRENDRRMAPSAMFIVVPKTGVFAFNSQAKYFQHREPVIGKINSLQHVIWPKSQVQRTRISSGIELKGEVERDTISTVASQPNLKNNMVRYTSYDMYAEAFAPEGGRKFSWFGIPSDAFEVECEKQFMYRRDFAKYKSSLLPYMNKVMSPEDADDALLRWLQERGLDMLYPALVASNVSITNILNFTEDILNKVITNPTDCKKLTDNILKS